MKEYIPTSLRNLSPKKVYYDIGIKFANGIYYEPQINSEQEIDILEKIGSHNSVILKHNIDGSFEEIWEWNNGKWVSLD